MRLELCSNVCDIHICREKYAPEKILTFGELIEVIQTERDLSIFLLIAPRNNIVVTKLLELMSEKDVADACKRIVFCSRSPLIIYQVSHVFLSLYTSVLWCLTYLINMLQLRRIHQELICGLWLDKIAKTNLPHFLRNSALFISALGAFYRNIIGFVLGISVVYLHKNEYNA